MARRVFDRLGLWIVAPAELSLRRIEAIRALGIRDLFFPAGSAGTPATVHAELRARAAGCYLHAWLAVDGRGPYEYADAVLAWLRTHPGGCDLNIELGRDDDLAPYIDTVLTRIRRHYPRRPLRLNLAPWKGAYLPESVREQWARVAPVWVAGQTYAGDMAPYPPLDVWRDLVGHGVPVDRASLCYGAAGPVGGTAPARVCTLPLARLPRDGVVFHEQLLVEVGVLP